MIRVEPKSKPTKDGAKPKAAKRTAYKWTDPGGAITQDQLAALVEVSQPAVSGWEKGTTFPTLPALVKLADVLATTVDDLVANEAEKVAG